jgi:cystathionine beta-lyase
MLPLWIADMDFNAPPPIEQAIKNRASKLVFGYTGLDEDYYEAIQKWFLNRHNRKIERDWIVFTPGVVPAINFAIQALTLPADKIIVQSPVYYPFYSAVENNGRTLVHNTLKIVEKDGKPRYEMDFDDLEVKAEGARMIILCSPHNPVGRVWTREELKRLGDIAIKNDLFVVSDEIHCDITYDPKAHVSFLEVSPELAQRCLVCTSISKTFNLPGFQVSNIFIPNKRIRFLYNESMKKAGLWGPNCFTPIALLSCYGNEEAENWFNQCMDYIKVNLEYTKTYLGEHLPEVKVVEPEGTTLVWLDLRGLGLTDEEIRRKMINEAHLVLDDGKMFKQGGSGFTRLNLACPLQYIKFALWFMQIVFGKKTE